MPRAALRDALSGPAEAFQGAAGRFAEPAADAEPTIHVTIGRIEVKAPPAAPPPVRPARQGPRVTLSEYLRRRRERR